MSVIIYTTDPAFHQASYDQGYQDGGNSATEDCHAIMYDDLGADLERVVRCLETQPLPLSPGEQEAVGRLREWLDFRA